MHGGLPAGGRLGPSGPIPKTKAFRVAGIFYTGMFEYDSKFVYVGLQAAESFFGIPGATGVELKVKDVDDARRIASTVLNTLEGYPYRTKDWGEMNRNLFSALRLEKLVMGIILSIIVVVAAGLIVATVIMLVLEKRKEISVLKALGVPHGGIVKIFLAEGLQIGIAGGLLGLFSGLAWCLFIEKVGIRLDPEVYYIPSLPVKIEPLQTALDRAHRGAGHLPRVHLPGAAGLARRAGGRAEGGVGRGLRRDPRAVEELLAARQAHRRAARPVARHRARRAGLAWWAPRARGRAPSSTCSGPWTRRWPGAWRSTGVDVLGARTTPTWPRFRNRTMGFVFQSHYLLPEFTALENVAMPALVQRMRSHRRRCGRARGLLERVGLGARVDHRPGELSGGEAQRVALARALVLEPALLLADEPTGNLDPVTGEGIHQVLREVNRDLGITAVVVTHNEALARSMPRRLRLTGGKVEPA